MTDQNTETTLSAITKVGEAFEEFKKGHAAKLDSFIDRLEDLEAKRNLPGKTGSTRPARWGVTTDGKRVPVLEKADRLADHFDQDTEWSLSGFVRGSMGIDEKSVLERGAATVPTAISARIIDAVREKARVVQAGALTIPITGKTVIARIDEDPVVYQHAEGADDIQESVPVLSPVTLDPKSLVALIPLTLEIVQDSPNLDAALQAAIAAAFASKLDQLAVATILTDADIPTSASGQATDSWLGVMAAVSAALALNQDVPRAMIANAADYAARAMQIEDSSGMWLGAPPVLRDMADLETTAVDPGTAILGDFSRGVGIASRQDLRLELIRWHKPGSATHLLACYSRMEGYILQPDALFVQQATTTG